MVVADRVSVCAAPIAVVPEYSCTVAEVHRATAATYCRASSAMESMLAGTGPMAAWAPYPESWIVPTAPLTAVVNVA
ncbi:MAG: hypothetical protein LC708_03150 [Actinobacteria bacterium]|nr:hypothetical protein [Actinomycetota bacterium]